MNQFIVTLIALAKAIPIIDKWLERLLNEYQKYKQTKLEQQNTDAVKDAIETQDQRPLESDQYSGKPSGHGTVVNSLPRMRDKK